MVTTPSVGTSPGPVSDSGQIRTIVADAHSGQYFSNKFGDTYPKAAKIDIVRGMATTTDGNPNVSDALLACSLFYIETHMSLMELAMKDRSRPRSSGSKQGSRASTT